MLLVRDVLDKPLLDREGRRCGAVDCIVLVIDDEGAFEGPLGIVGPTAPRVAALELGALTLARRFGRLVGGCVATLASMFDPRTTAPTRIAFERVRGTGERVVIDADWERERLLSIATWMSRGERGI